MDIEKLKALENAAYRLAGYTADLVELETVPDIYPPTGFESREEYRFHLGNMIGCYRTLLGITYNEISEWQNI